MTWHEHLIISQILWILTWHLFLKRTVAMQNEIHKIDKYYGSCIENFLDYISNIFL